MKNTIFSRGLYAESLRRLRVFGLIALAVMVIIQLAPLIVGVVDYYSLQSYYAEQEGLYGEVAKHAPDPVNASAVFLATPFTVTIVTPIMVLLVFSVFNKRASSDFYHALPYTRTCMFVSTMAAVFAWVISICLICSAAGLVSYTAFPKIFTVTFDGTSELLLSYLAILLLTSGGTALAMSATGTVLSNICVALLILFLPRFIMTIMTMWIANSAEFLAFNVVGNSFLSYDINVLFGTVAKIVMEGEIPDYFNNLSADIYSIVLGLIYLGLALLVFITRKSETATCPAPGRGVQHVIRILLTMVVGIFATILFVEGELAGFIIVSLLTAIVYFAYELITTHRWKNLLKALPFFGVVVGLCIVCGAVIILVPKVASLYTPNAENIDSVRLVDNGYGYNDEWFGEGTENLELTDKTIIAKVSETLKKNMEAYREYGYVGTYSYEITDDSMYPEYGKPEAIIQTVAITEGSVTKYRTVFFPQDDYNAVLNALEKNEEYIKACKKLPRPAKNSLDFDIYDREVDYSYYEEVFKCMQKEINSLPFEDWYKIANNMSLAYTEYNLWYYTDDYDSKYISIPISSDYFPKTFTMLLATDKVDRENRYETVNMLVNDDEFAERDDIVYASLDVTVRMPEEDGIHRYYQIYVDSHSYDWSEHRYREALKDMFEKVEACDKEPSSDSYILITYQYECHNNLEKYDEKFDETYESDYGSIYLPFPEDFDPEAFGFDLVVYGDELNYYYK